jgi:hypothetical protein
MVELMILSVISMEDMFPPWKLFVMRRDDRNNTHQFELSTASPKPGVSTMLKRN